MEGIVKRRGYRGAKGYIIGGEDVVVTKSG